MKPKSIPGTGRRQGGGAIGESEALPLQHHASGTLSLTSRTKRKHDLICEASRNEGRDEGQRSHNQRGQGHARRKTGGDVLTTGLRWDQAKLYLCNMIRVTFSQHECVKAATPC